VTFVLHKQNGEVLKNLKLEELEKRWYPSHLRSDGGLLKVLKPSI